MKKIVIIQRALPFYRVPLFEKLLDSKELDFYLINGSNKSLSGSETKITSRKALQMTNVSMEIKNFEFLGHLSLIRKLQEIKPDVVILEGMISNITNWYLIHLKKKMGFQLISWVCGYQNYTGNVKDFLLRKYFNSFDYCLAYHTAAKKFLVEYGFPEEKITVLYNAIKVDLTYNKETILEIKEKYSLTNKHVVFFMGRILESKKLELLFNAMKSLGEKYVCLVVGNGDYLPVLKEQYKDSVNIRFAGEVIEGKENYFKASDVFALPGPGGLALNETLFHGLPIVSSLADGSAEDLVINGYNGFLIKDVTPEKLAEKIQYIFEKNMIKQYSENSLRLGKKFGFDNFVKNFVRGVKECIENHEQANLKI